MISPKQLQEDFLSRVLRAAGVILLFLIYFLHEFPEYLAGNVKYVGMSLLSFLLISVFVCLCFEAATIRMLHALMRDREAVARRLLVLTMIALGSLTHLNKVFLNHRMYVQARIVTLPISMGNIAVWAAMTLAALVFLIRLPRTNTPIHVLAVLWGIVLRLMVLQAVTFDPQGADMLYCIDRTCDAVLHGTNPYEGLTCTASPSHAFPLLYFPLLWLPYLPFKALSFDLRWLNLLAQLGLFFFIWFLTGRDNRSASRSLVLILLALLPDMIWTFFYRQLSLYWLVGVLYLWFVRRQRWNLSLLAVSGLVAMRITALTTLWIYLIYIWKRRGLRVAAIHGLSVAGVLSLSFLPFLGVGLARLKYLFFDALVDFAAKGTWQQPLSMLAAGGILKAVGMERVLMPLQISGLVLIGLFYRMSRDQSFRLFAGLSAFAYAYFLWLSTFIYIYYWFFPILMMSVLYLIESRTPPKAGSMAADMHGGDGADSSVTCSQATP